MTKTETPYLLVPDVPVLLKALTASAGVISAYVLQFAQAEHGREYTILERYKPFYPIHGELVTLTQDNRAVLTHIVRHAQVSSRRTKNVVLPYQNHAGGDTLRLCATTFSAYSKRSVVSVLQSVVFCQHLNIPDPLMRKVYQRNN